MADYQRLVAILGVVATVGCARDREGSAGRLEPTSAPTPPAPDSGWAYTGFTTSGECAVPSSQPPPAGGTGASGASSPAGGSNSAPTASYGSYYALYPCVSYGGLDGWCGDPPCDVPSPDALMSTPHSEHDRCRVEGYGTLDLVNSLNATWFFCGDTFVGARYVGDSGCAVVYGSYPDCDDTCSVFDQKGDPIFPPCAPGGPSGG